VVARRPVYELVLKPRDPASLVGQVRLAIDSKTGLPLRVEVFAKGGKKPAFETGFTQLQTSTPADSVFGFTPPPGAKVTAGSKATGPGARTSTAPSTSQPTTPRSSTGSPTTVGSGWTSVLVLPAGSATSLGSNATVGALLKGATPATGTFGGGRLLQTPLLSVLMLSDGRILVGAVTPAVLEQAATSTASTAATP
jgi:hypothetical protein